MICDLHVQSPVSGSHDPLMAAPRSQAHDVQPRELEGSRLKVTAYFGKGKKMDL